MTETTLPPLSMETETDLPLLERHIDLGGGTLGQKSKKYLENVTFLGFLPFGGEEGP